MEKKNLFPFIYDDLPIKFNLCYFSTINISTEFNIKDPIYNLLQYTDVEHTIKLKEGHITKFIYLNRENIDKMLYDSNKNIYFKYYENNNNLSFYFYLLLLINDKNEILNYTYDPQYLKKIYDEQRQNNDNFKKLIISKIIIELSNYLKDINDFNNDENEEKINKIITENLVKIEKIINDPNMEIKWTKEEICSKRIDEIYLEIINGLIIQQKLENSEKKIKELDLNNISLTKTMIDGLFKTLNNKDYIKDYIIAEKNDLFNNKKINFYYILLFYILKTSFYIYQIPFLFKTKKSIKNILKDNKNIIIENNDILNKIKYIVKKFGYSDKYIKLKKKGIGDLLLNYFHHSSSKLPNTKLYLSLLSSQISQSSSYEQNEKKSLLHVINFVNEILSDKDNIESLSKNSFIDENIEKKLKQKKYSNNEEDKVREIITNIKFKQLIKDAYENENFNIKLTTLIREIFSFEVYKKIEPQNANEKSVNKFRDWIKNYKPESNQPV